MLFYFLGGPQTTPFFLFLFVLKILVELNESSPSVNLPLAGVRVAGSREPVVSIQLPFHVQ